MARRYERGSIVVTSNLSFGAWDQALAGDAVLSAAMLGELLRHDIVARVSGESYRLKGTRKEGLFPHVIAVP